MDENLVKGIAHELLVEFNLQITKSVGVRSEAWNMAERIARAVHKLGYRKLPKDKPPLLSMDDIKANPKFVRIYNRYAKKHPYGEAARAVQREVDIKHYEG